MEAALEADFEDDGPLVIQLHAASSSSSSSVSTPTNVSDGEQGGSGPDSDDDSEWDSLVEAMQQQGGGPGGHPAAAAAALGSAAVAAATSSGGGGGGGGGGSGQGVRLARSQSAQQPVHSHGNPRLRPTSASPSSGYGCSSSAFRKPESCSGGGSGGGSGARPSGAGASAHGAAQSPGGGGSGQAAAVAAAAAGASWRRRRAAFVAGSVSTSASQRRLQQLLPPRPAARDILLPRLPAPALDLIVPSLPPATRAALRLCCRQLRALVDAHTQSLTLRPDRRAADCLNRRGVKAFQMFPALRQATLVLAGSNSGASGPALARGAAATRGGSGTTAAAAGADGGDVAYAAADTAGGAGAGTRRLGRAGSAGGRAGRSGRLLQHPGPRSLAASPLLPLSGWLVVCGTAECLTRLTLHVGDVALLEDLALGVTHPHLQRLDVSIGRSGMAHATPPVVQFMVGVLQGLRHLRLAWAGPQADAAATSSLAHGPRRLFLDGRPRLGPLLLAALADLPQLSSLELQGFIIDTDGNAVLARHWPLLAPRLRRLVLRGLHLMVPTDVAPGEQLGELLGACGGLQGLEADLCLPAALGMMPGGGGGAAAAALLLSLMYAARDVKAVKLELLPTSLTRLCLPGVTVAGREGLEALARLRQLAVLEVAGLAAGAGEYLPALQELRLSECGWRQVLDMLPWRPPQPQPQQPPSPGGGGGSAEAAAAAPAAPRVEAWAAAGPGAAAVAAEPGPAAGAAAPAAAPAAAAAAAAHRRAPAPLLLPGHAVEAAAAAAGAAGAAEPSPPRQAAAEGAASAAASPRTPGSCSAAAAAAATDMAGSPPAGGACGRRQPTGLQLLEVVCSERLDDWHAPDRTLLARVARGLLPLVDAGCRVQLKVAADAQPHIWNESDVDGKPWEPTAVWRHIKAAQNMRRLQAETSALAERLARGRLLQAQRRRDKEYFFVDR
ncbi:hypothetical protein HYH02_002948 [Chlamydomonas schloesseri]|uniref:F-box domain-containing protein n=1 Tax=Chlamydomonas schloesseri TaxID=2026947 RepID=A0A835WU03_9CHLO|nr:hypothetical protein HYH02_002948 [Chlamydomonas schloesseri]|eukprot:KAG2452716.1 hypothetical protein HYH02_002948 [Chlamydomonas schloesseri]